MNKQDREYVKWMIQDAVKPVTLWDLVPAIVALSAVVGIAIYE